MATWLISRRAGILYGSKDYILLNKRSAVSRKEQNLELEGSQNILEMQLS